MKNHLIIAALATGAASSQDFEKPINRSLFRDGSWTLYLDNDVFNGTDRYYTNGFRFAHLSRDFSTEELPAFYQGAGRLLLPNFRNDATVKNVGFSFGQSIFTPADTRTTAPQIDDRPYAAWLYLGGSLQAKTQNRLDLLEINVGVVGPSALGEELQNLVHDVMGSDRALGWDNQLDDEFAFNLYYQRKWRQKFLFGQDPGGWGVSLHSSVGASLGNVHIDANAGAAIRFGFNLPDDFGSNRITPVSYVQPAPSLRSTDNRGFGLYIFAGVDGYARAHNAFLDGGVWRNGRSVDSRVFVGELEVGIAATWNEWRLGYTQVFRTEEFRGQDTGSQNFGTVALSFRF
jgi:hypothetical protein